jgi:hypothetical protein
MASPVAEAAELQGSAVAVDMRLLPLAKMASLTGCLRSHERSTAGNLCEVSVISLTTRLFPKPLRKAITQKEKIDHERSIFFHQSTCWSATSASIFGATW